MIFRVTLKLATKLKVELPSVAVAAEASLLDWSANLFTVQRKQWVLLVNTPTLYAALMPGAGVASGEDFVEDALGAIGKRMCRDGWATGLQR